MSYEIIKSKLINIYQKEIDILEDICTETKKIGKGNLLFFGAVRIFNSQHSNDDLISLCECCKCNLMMIERTKKKCVTFGNTSNGKSTVLNALLGNEILPSDVGKVTSCFISIEGCPGSRSYIMDKDNNKQEISALNSLTSEYSSDKYNINSVLRVFWPRSECHILKEDVELWDSPGLDYSKDNDEWINKYCRDADVFLLVIDGRTTFKKSEKEFFQLLNNRCVIPGVIILVNKWDLTVNSKQQRKMIERQHTESIKDCFVKDMKLYNDKEIEERIFFISAAKYLSISLPKGIKEPDCNMNQQYDIATFVDGRLSGENSEENKQFEKFREKLNDDLSVNATKTKLRKNIKYSLEIARKISDHFHLFRNNVRMKDTKMNSNLNSIPSELISQCHEEFDKIIGDIHQQLDSLADRELHEYGGIKELIKSWTKENTSGLYTQAKKICADAYNRMVHGRKQGHGLFDKLSEQMNSIFVKEIKNMEIQFTDLFCNNCLVKMEHKEIDLYFHKFLNFDNIIQKLNEWRKIELEEEMNKKITNLISGQQYPNIDILLFITKDEVKNKIGASKEQKKASRNHNRPNQCQRVSKKDKKLQSKSDIPGTSRPLSEEKKQEQTNTEIINVSSNDSETSDSNLIEAEVNRENDDESSKSFNTSSVGNEKHISKITDEENAEKKLEEEILNILTEYVKQYIGILSKRIEFDIKEKIEKCVNNYVQDQEELLEMLEKFNKNNEIIDQLKVEIYSIGETESE